MSLILTQVCPKTMVAAFSFTANVMRITLQSALGIQSTFLGRGLNVSRQLLELANKIIAIKPKQGKRFLNAFEA